MMPNKRWRYVATLMVTSGMLVSTLASCGQPDTTSLAPSATASLSELTPAPAVKDQQTSGISGQAMQGPMCGGPARKDTPCPDMPIEATIIVEDAQTGQRVTEFMTGVDGTYRQALAPGTYRLVARNKQGGPLPVAQPIEVTVERDQSVEVIIRFDTGMR